MAGPGTRASGQQQESAVPAVLAPEAQFLLCCAVGFVVSFFVAWAVIAWFMDWVKKRGFVPFAIYRMIVGAIVLWIVYSQSNGA